MFLLSLFHNSATYTAQGRASFYADRMQGHATASGERYDKKLYTAAHATLPFDTKVLVTNLNNGKSVVVRINDRKARHRHNVIDLSRAAAQEIGMIRSGSAAVRLKEVKNEQTGQQAQPAAVSEAKVPRK
nr:septal ring lytic transglycosylase RlpA family protein [Pontibacter sp. E15-1]